ncbi:uncharacterized protein LOC135475816 [Liolophura sinensis]|uniref:uncharacterized protein LOC135475816 n=1 Tax=Liolophura sinensis TaxID=3198878 RepID=UPI00315930E0
MPEVKCQNNLAINVFGWDKGVVVYHISKQSGDLPRINLLWTENDSCDIVIGWRQRKLAALFVCRHEPEKIHFALRFGQSPWMEPYIRMNTELRKQATSSFEKDLYKLMNNTVFGKRMENLRKRAHVKLVQTSEEAVTFDSQHILLQSSSTRTTSAQPLRLCGYERVLDLSKYLMYDFYYNQMKAQYGEHCQLLYTDTDSLLLEMQTEDVYRQICRPL